MQDNSKKVNTLVIILKLVDQQLLEVQIGNAIVVDKRTEAISE